MLGEPLPGRPPTRIPESVLADAAAESPASSAPQALKLERELKKGLASLHARQQEHEQLVEQLRQREANVQQLVEQLRQREANVQHLEGIQKQHVQLEGEYRALRSSYEMLRGSAPNDRLSADLKAFLLREGKVLAETLSELMLVRRLGASKLRHLQTLTATLLDLHRRVLGQAKVNWRPPPSPGAAGVRAASPSSPVPVPALNMPYEDTPTRPRRAQSALPASRSQPRLLPDWVAQLPHATKYLPPHPGDAYRGELVSSPDPQPSASETSETPNIRWGARIEELRTELQQARAAAAEAEAQLERERAEKARLGQEL